MFQGPIVLTTGCFHYLHPGHIELFEYCKYKYKVINNYEEIFPTVIVGINGDDYIKKKYGKVKISLQDRIYVISSIQYVDSVLVFNEDDPCKLIETIRPDIFVKGPDYKNQIIPELEICRNLGITFHIASQLKRYNANEILKDLK